MKFENVSNETKSMQSRSSKWTIQYSFFEKKFKVKKTFG